ncbi:unnamed protein product [Pleuronectes platessa]|uniref:Uncharacterized protein n=1 Tax=Pleuronectes platessa TaxID=8262 RepID=A0A9N7W0B4_PLEPL|nr:unnamed protein product [Pleuronectes platessa]
MSQFVIGRGRGAGQDQGSLRRGGPGGRSRTGLRWTHPARPVRAKHGSRFQVGPLDNALTRAGERQELRLSSAAATAPGTGTTGTSDAELEVASRAPARDRGQEQRCKRGPPMLKKHYDTSAEATALGERCTLSGSRCSGDLTPRNTGDSHDDRHPSRRGSNRRHGERPEL